MSDKQPANRTTEQSAKQPVERRSGEGVFALLLLVFSGLALWQSYDISKLEGLSEPGVFPMLASGTMLLSGLFIVRDAFSRRYLKSKARGPQALREFYLSVLPPQLLVTIALVAFYVAVMPMLGFLLSSALFLLTSFAYLWRKSTWVSIGLTALSLIFIYVIFRIVFQVVLPKGSLFVGTWLSVYL